MPLASISLSQLRKRLAAYIAAYTYTPAALGALRHDCGQIVQQLATQSDDILRDASHVNTVLRVVQLINRYLHHYGRTYPFARHEVVEFYELKHALLNLFVCASPNPWYRYTVGRATDNPAALSVRVYIQGSRPWNVLVHWPMQHVPPPARQAITTATGSWPPPDYIPE